MYYLKSLLILFKKATVPMNLGVVASFIYVIKVLYQSVIYTHYVITHLKMGKPDVASDFKISTSIMSLGRNQLELNTFLFFLLLPISVLTKTGLIISPYLIFCMFYFQFLLWLFYELLKKIQIFLYIYLH